MSSRVAPCAALEHPPPPAVRSSFPHVPRVSAVGAHAQAGCRPHGRAEVIRLSSQTCSTIHKIRQGSLLPPRPALSSWDGRAGGPLVCRTSRRARSGSRCCEKAALIRKPSATSSLTRSAGQRAHTATAAGSWVQSAAPAYLSTLGAQWHSRTGRLPPKQDRARIAILHCPDIASVYHLRPRADSADGLGREQAVHLPRRAGAQLRRWNG